MERVGKTLRMSLLWRVVTENYCMIAVFTGLPGSGKSLKLADTLVNVLYRNRNHYEKAKKKYVLQMNRAIKAGEPTQGITPPIKRILWTNLKFKPKVEEEFPDYIKYWTDLKQLIPLRDVDIAIDEIATYFDSRLWETLSLEMRRFLAQHRKFGVEIYGTAQDFAQTDKAFRRLTSHLFLLRKIIGSGDISPTRPAPRWIWGVVVVRELDPTVYDEQKSKFGGGGMIPSFMTITRAATEIFDTRAEVRLSQTMPLKHIEKACELPNCPFHKTIHV